MTAPTSPAHPCVEAKDADGSKFYVDRLGFAWDAASGRLPRLDAPPALEPSLSAASVAEVLANRYWAAVALQDGGDQSACDTAETMCAVIRDVAAALGVLAAFEKARGGA